MHLLALVGQENGWHASKSINLLLSGAEAKRCSDSALCPSRCHTHSRVDRMIDVWLIDAIGADLVRRPQLMNVVVSLIMLLGVSIEGAHSSVTGLRHGRHHDFYWVINHSTRSKWATLAFASSCTNLVRLALHHWQRDVRVVDFFHSLLDWLISLGRGGTHAEDFLHVLACHGGGLTIEVVVSSVSAPPHPLFRYDILGLR